MTRREELLERLRHTDFLIAENAATGEVRLMPPAGLYQRTKDLEVYFDGNPEAWFAGDGYGPWLAQLRAMGGHNAIGRIARPDEFAAVAAFLASERASFITGGVHLIDGGASVMGPELPHFTNAPRDTYT